MQARLSVGRAVAAVVLLSMAGCKAPPEPLVIENNMVRVENHTDKTWTNVEIWVNDHYRATRPSIAPGERLQVPLDVFVAGSDSDSIRAGSQSKGFRSTASRATNR